MTYLDDEERREAARARLRARQARHEAAEGAKSSRWPFKKASDSRAYSRDNSSSSAPDSGMRRSRKQRVDEGVGGESEASFDTTSAPTHESSQSHTGQYEGNFAPYEGNLAYGESPFASNTSELFSTDENEQFAPEQMRNGRVVERLHDPYIPRRNQAYEFTDNDTVAEGEGWPDDYRFDEPRSLPEKALGVFGKIAGGITSVLQSIFLAAASLIESVRDRFGLKGLIIPAVALLLLLVLLFQSCSSAPANDSNNDQEPTTTEADADAGPSAEQVALAAIIGDDLAAQMFSAAESNEGLTWIANNSGEYATAGESHQRKLLKLAAEEPEAIPFVRAYPDAYPASEASGASSSLDSGTGIPLIYQWDTRWANTKYSGSAFGLTGCCPTSLAMVYQGITRKTDMSPYDMGVLAAQNGFVSENDGTYGDFLLTWGANLGLRCSELPVDAGSLKQALQNGDVVIANVGTGDFTEGGHFIVVTGLAENGEATVNDPYSAINSSKTWSVDTIADQSIRMFLFER